MNKILIIDDDPQLTDLFYAKLSSSGFEVSKAFNGEEGYKLAKTFKPDLILLDLKMPVWDGAETLSHLRKDPETENTKVIILSSFNDWSAIQMDGKSAQALGAIDFFPKGMDLEELVFRIKKIISS